MKDGRKKRNKERKPKRERERERERETSYTHTPATFRISRQLIRGETHVERK